MHINKEEVVISGISGAFPSCSNIDEFKQRLLNNESLITSRWKEGEMGVSNAIGVIKGVERFDASYFGIHTNQCNFLDPMHRLVLERTFEALIDAGISPTEIRGKKVGVFAGATVGENDNLFYESVISGFGITGHARSMMPNRISWWLNLKGPSCAYDGNWLNGIDALQSAYECISEGFCESAIVATSNLLINSEISFQYNDLGLLSQDGTTKSFDDDASGYARSDGVVVLYIQRASDAKRCYASILGIDTIYNGYRNGTLLNIDTNGMQNFLADFYIKRNLDARNVDFVECYGAGRKVTDEAELAAIDAVFCKNRETPLLVGSVKPNTGHAESTAALFSIAKVLVAIESETIPANINYTNPNRRISALTEGRIKVVSENTKWNPRLVAINATGLSSSYGHILLQAHDKVKQHEPSVLPRLLTLSTRTDEGIQECLTLLKGFVSVDPDYAALVHDTFKKSIHGHLYRGYAVLNVAEPQTACDYYPGKKRAIWFVYSGMGSQWCKMATDLMVLPIFASTIHNCHKILESKGLDLIRILTEDDDKMFENILHSFVGIAAVQIALTDVLRALGVVPDGIMGHSVGELGCAYVDGCLTAEQMILAAYSRGRASLDATLIKGMMAAVGMDYEKLKNTCPPTIEIACHNSADSCTISGPSDDVETFVEQLKAKEIFAKLVNVSNIAYHSSYIKPAGPLLLESLKEVIPEALPRSSKWISTSIPEENWDSDLAKTSSAEYHTNNLLSPVLFAESSKHIPKDAIVIEIAPHGLLQAILKRSLGINCTNIPLTNKSSKNGLLFLLGAIGRLYVCGLDTNVAALYPPVTYPVSRGTKSLTPLVHWEHGEELQSGTHFKTDYITCVKNYDVSLQLERYRYLIEHQINKTIVISVSVYLEFLLEIYFHVFPNLTCVVFENLKFKEVHTLPKLGATSFFIMIQKGSGEFEISSGSQVVAIGRIKIPEGENVVCEVVPLEAKDGTVYLSEYDVYSEFEHRGHTLTGSFRNIRQLGIMDKGSIAKIHWNNSWDKFTDGMLQQYLFRQGQRDQNIFTVSAIQRIIVNVAELPTEPCEIDSTYDYATEIISSASIQIFGVSSKPFSHDFDLVSFDSVEFTKFSNIIYENIEGGINLGLQLVIHNFEKPTDALTIVEIDTENPSFETNINNVAMAHQSITVRVSKMHDTELILVSPTEPLLVITNDVINNNMAKLIATSHAFLLVKTSEDVVSFPKIIQVAQFSVDGTSYSILRKSAETPYVVVNITSKVVAFSDLNGNIPWAKDVRTALDQHGNKRIYLVFNVMPQEGVDGFVYSIRQFLRNPNLRFVFHLDAKAPAFKTNEKAYQDTFRKDLVLTVIKDGAIGDYISVPTRFGAYKINKIHHSSDVENVHFEYLGIHAYDGTIINKKLPNILGNIDYSGVTNTGKRIMGLAHFDKQQSKVVADSILCWDVPEWWTIEDAATIPQAYCSAYYALIYKARMDYGETVLIHGGCTAFGLAAISIAATYHANIFVTVTSLRQKAYLLKQNKFLLPTNVLDAHNISFEPRLLLATGGRGAHIVLNCLSGSMLDATLRCVAEFGKIAQIGQLDLEENTEIGMKVFLKNVSICSITGHEIVNASSNVKKQLFEFINSGIQKIVVRPLRRSIVGHCNVKSIFRTLRHVDHVGSVLIKISGDTKLNMLNTANPEQFVCDPHKSYIMIGGLPDIYIDIIEWIAFRGGKRIIVASESQSKENNIGRRLTLLENNFGVTVEYVSFSKQNISHLKSLQAIGIVFMLPRGFQELDYTFLEDFLRKAVQSTSKEAILVNLSSESVGVCTSKLMSILPVYNIQSENSLGFSEVVRAIDKSLCLKERSILIKDERIRDGTQKSFSRLYKNLGLLLPNSISHITNQTALASSKAGFFELPSLCALPAREIPPVFIIPGMFMRNAAEELATHLLYPSYCATLPLSYKSLETLAQDFAEEMQIIYPDGPYNIIALSYGGPLAIQIVNKLEYEHQRVQLYLIDGAPDTIQGSLKHLGERSYRESSLLCRILNITNIDVMRNITSLPDWERKLQFALNSIQSSATDKIFLREALTALLKYFDEVSSANSLDSLILGLVHLILPVNSNKYDDCGLSKYTKQNPKIYVVDADTTEIAKSKDSAHIINKHVIF